MRQAAIASTSVLFTGALSAADRLQVEYVFHAREILHPFWRYRDRDSPETVECDEAIAVLAASDNYPNAHMIGQRLTVNPASPAACSSARAYW
jgi:hypothetical protein